MSYYALENELKLEQLACQDDIYTVWQKSFELYAQSFAEFADRQPEEIRNILWGYAEAGRMMQQRKVNLACAHMEFK